MANENNKFLSLTGLQSLVSQIYNIFLTKRSAQSDYTTKKEFTDFKKEIEERPQVDTDDFAKASDLQKLERTVNQNSTSLNQCLTQTEAEKTYEKRITAPRTFDFSKQEEPQIISQSPQSQTYEYNIYYYETDNIKVEDFHDIVINNHTDDAILLYLPEKFGTIHKYAETVELHKERIEVLLENNNMALFLPHTSSRMTLDIGGSLRYTLVDKFDLTPEDIGAAQESHNHDNNYALKSHTHNYVDPKNGVYSTVIEDPVHIHDYITLERPMCRLFIPTGPGWGSGLLAGCIEALMYPVRGDVTAHINSAWDPALSDYFYSQNIDEVIRILEERMIGGVGVFFNIHTIFYYGKINAFIDIEIY